MPGPSLTATTVSYLFASSWAPAGGSDWDLQVPGGSVDGPVTAANLLNLAIWSLGEHGMVEVEQLRPVQPEPATVMGGQPFARLRALETGTGLPGLEGALLAKGREGLGEGGVRELVLALDLHDKAPWVSVAGHCFAEARDAGLVELTGRLTKKPVIIDQGAVNALADRDAEIATARAAYREKHPDPDAAVIGDCLAAIRSAHQS